MINNFKDLQSYFNDYELKSTGYCASREWLRKQINIVTYLTKFPFLNMDRGRFWEYPFVLSQCLAKGKNLSVLDLGAGDCSFSTILSSINYSCTGVDNHKTGWHGEKNNRVTNNVNFIESDISELKDIKDNSFDIVLLISVIEHVSTNTICIPSYQSESKKIEEKTGQMMLEDNSNKMQVLKEALRVLKQGGILIATSEIWFEYSNEMNIDFNLLFGTNNINRENIIANFSLGLKNDLYYFDLPIHKGRETPIGITIEKL